MIFFKAFKHLLPSGRAWRLTYEKTLRKFFEGLAASARDARIFFDLVWLDVFPDTTRELAAWERQFGLRDVGLTEDERRSRLLATWRAVGGQDPRYIEDTLRANGFDVYVHEWWEPDSRPAVGVKACATPRNPNLVLRREFTGLRLLVECGEEKAECGEDFAQAGNSLNPRGYPLVNKVTATEPDLFTLCGEEVAACGEEVAACGNYTRFTETQRNYVVPSDAAKWPYFLYIGGEEYPEIAQVDPKRRAEFEELCLRICPAQQWLGILVEYG